MGEKRIGIAKADSNTRIAVPVGYVDVNGLEWQEIAHIAELNNTNFFVLGLPRSNEGNETAQSAYVRQFARNLLEQLPNAKIRLQDESLTSVVAEERLKTSRKKYEKGDIDAEAAAIILQDFLEGLHDAKERTGLSSAGVSMRPSPVSRTKLSSGGNPANPQTNTETDSAKPKKRGVTRLIIGVVVAGLLAGGATAAVAIVQGIKEAKARERAEYYAALEAEMEAATFDFTIRPGETIYDIKKHLLEVDRSDDGVKNYTATEIDVAFEADYDFAFLKDRPEGATLEGYLYPETYNFYANATVEDILTKYLTKMGEVIEENELESKYAQRGLTLHEGIILASVVQKESPASEMATVAQVFLSRLAYGIPLGSDVTVSYALDTIDPDRETYVDNQAALAVDSCYNTRLYGGLPCGAISNPGLTALLAVAEPSDTAYLYFLTGDDGLMYYSYTEFEHNQNIYSHCQELCNASL